MKPFYNRLSYSFGNEDWVTEQQALQTAPSSRILCITASGDRPLNLLSSPCASLHTVDANAYQTALFDLKKTALNHLSFQDYIAFLGLQSHANRWALFKSITPHLAPSSVKIWAKHKRKITKGILFQGTVERFSNKASICFKALFEKKILKLFNFSSLDEQRAFIDKEFDNDFWKGLFKFILHPKLLCKLLKDPGLTDFVDQNIHVGEYLHHRFSQSLKTFLAKESTLLSLLFLGQLHPEHLPPYLRSEDCQIIVQGLKKTTFETNSVLTVLNKAAPGDFDRFSFSDIASYMPQHMFHQMLSSMIRVSPAGGRFCIRQFLSNYSIPNHLKPFLKRDPLLEKQLEQQDRCCVYRFFVGEVVK
jgi:S-adenosylmethionine-diacylglycerol 3-amino-3-carboxypropyl transferase